jgi:DNA polymerase III epsilon subunit-like protein
MIIDTETTGLPTKAPGMSFTEQPNPKDFSKYDSARLLQIGICIYDSATKEKRLYNWFVNVDFHIPDSKFHKITNKICAEQGDDFPRIAENLNNLVKSVNHIVAYNISFDICIIMSELYRIGKLDFANRIMNKSKFCAMEYCKQLTGGYMKLLDFYAMYVPDGAYNSDNAHDALADADATHRVLLASKFYE